MAGKADWAIAVAMFARSVLACDASLLPVGGDASRCLAAHGSGEALTAADPVLWLAGGRRGRGLSQDPGRSRPSAEPIPAAPYANFPPRAEG